MMSRTTIRGGKSKLLTGNHSTPLPEALADISTRSQQQLIKRGKRHSMERRTQWKADQDKYLGTVLAGVVYKKHRTHIKLSLNNPSGWYFALPGWGNNWLGPNKTRRDAVELAIWYLNERKVTQWGTQLSA